MDIPEHQGERPEEGVTARSQQTNAAALTNETSAETEHCHPTYNKPRPGMKGIILSHQTFMDIPEHQTPHLHLL
jgi:hypothetical protein